MKSLSLLAILATALTGSAHALETAAGADTVNASQVGLDAKLNATNNILQTGINQILDCQKNGQLFDPTSKACIAVDETLAKKIAGCTTSKQFYNQNTGACMNSAPDLTDSVNSANALLTKLLACSNAKQFYNSSTGACSGNGSASLTQTYVSPVYANIKSRNDKTFALPKADLCVISLVKGSTSQPRGGCTMAGSPGNTWSITVSSYDDSARWCQATCYDLQ